MHNVYRVPMDGTVSHEEYVRVHSATVRILLGDEMSEAEVRIIVEEDWESDAKGAEELDAERVFDSLFELADLWCPNISAAEYLSFIDTIGCTLSAGGR